MTFSVTVLPSGRQFTANPDEAMLAAAIRQGVGMPYGCKDSACGSCKCKKIEGTVVHGPHQLKALSHEEEEAGFVLTCCGVAQTDVVLESRQVTDESAKAGRQGDFGLKAKLGNRLQNSQPIKQDKVRG